MISTNVKSAIAIALGAAALICANAPAPADEPAPAAAAEAPSPEGRFKGELVCASLPDQREVLRVPLDMTITAKGAMFARPIENDRGVLGSELGEGPVDGNAVRLTSAGTSLGSRYEGKYSGIITMEGGTLIGTQAWTFAGVTRTRPCAIAVVRSL